MMTAKNPRRTTSGRIDLEVEHPVLGWIPFTASPDDDEPGRTLYERAQHGEFGPVEDLVPDVPLPELLTAERTDALRRAAYQAEADPIFFKWQRGEAEKSAWLDKVSEIRARYPAG